MTKTQNPRTRPRVADAIIAERLRALGYLE